LVTLRSKVRANKPLKVHCVVTRAQTPDFRLAMSSDLEHNKPVRARIWYNKPVRTTISRIGQNLAQ